MSRLAWLAVAPLLAVTGCLELDPSPIPLVNSAPTASAKPAGPQRQISTAPPNEMSARRVIQVGQRLLITNPEIGLRPGFITPGVPYPEVFHRGGAMGGCMVVVSEGIVQACPSDAQLAAVLALELGKLVCEREAQTSPAARRNADRTPPNEAIGTDSGGAFGSSDGTRIMELARLEERQRGEKKALKTLEPRKLAEKYLTNAGYDKAALDQVAGLLRQAEDHTGLDKQFTIGPAR